MQNNINYKSIKICIVGLGYVGLPLVLLAKEKFENTTGIDIDQKKNKLINEGKLRTFSSEINKSLIKSSICATSDFKKIADSDISVICVPTPVFKNKKPNLNPLKEACVSVAKNLSKGTLIIVESTVNPGTCDMLLIPLIECVSKLKCGKDFDFAYCPERINPGDKRWNIQNTPRVLGSNSIRGINRAVKFYNSILASDIKKMSSIREAEACKILENTFRDVNIAFINEMAKSFDLLGINILKVIEGADTKPFAFLPHYPGCGVGGHCIPVDSYYLIESAKKNGFEHKLLKAAREINDSMPEYTLEKIIAYFKKTKIDIHCAKFAVIGLTYKPDVDDDRESPSYELIRNLRKIGIHPYMYDPYVLEKSTCKNLEEVFAVAEVIIMPVAHKLFIKKINSRFLQNHKIRLFVDGRNSFDKKCFKSANIDYIGIGQ